MCSRSGRRNVLGVVSGAAQVIVVEVVLPGDPVDHPDPRLVNGHREVLQKVVEGLAADHVAPA
jgi:hypothetical protein